MKLRTHIAEIPENNNLPIEVPVRIGFEGRIIGKAIVNKDKSCDIDIEEFPFLNQKLGFGGSCKYNDKGEITDFSLQEVSIIPI